MDEFEMVTWILASIVLLALSFLLLCREDHVETEVEVGREAAIEYIKTLIVYLNSITEEEEEK